MNSAPSRICLITPGHVASTPRLVKEANALVDSGYDVTVVAGRYFPPAVRLDEDLLRGARWRYVPVNFEGGSSLARKLLRQAAQSIVARRSATSPRLAASAVHAESSRFVAAAIASKADIFVGHCVTGIAAAGLAAQRTRRVCGADLEDWHEAETDAIMGARPESKAVRQIQAYWLPRMPHLTAAAPLIAEKYRASYGVNPAVVLNAFPLAEAPPVPVIPPPISEGSPAQFYWFSQTVGPGRGLEAMVRAIARMRTPAEIHLRGFVTPEYRSTLDQLATEARLRTPICFLPPAPAAEMARLAADAHVGLSLEQRSPLNRDLCLTNKIFAYLLAGIPQVLSMTAAQQLIAPQLGAAAQLVDLARPDETAICLDGWLADPSAQRAARSAAWQLARSRFCWDIEQQPFLDSLRHALALSRGT